MRAQFRFWLLRLALLFVTAAPAFAEDAPTPVVHATPAMWVVHGPRGTAYLLGSVHALPKNIEWQTPAIKAAIKSKTHVVTTSYVSPSMLELDEEAKKAGIVIMNEIGLDPGIDHLYAVKTIDDVHSKGGKVLLYFLGM